MELFMFTNQKRTRTTLLSAAVLAAALAAGFAMPAAYAAGNAPAAVSVSDQELIARVGEALARANLNNADIDVKVSNGRVHLTGWVYYPEDVQTVQRLTLQVSGVSKVDSNLRTWSSSERGSSDNS
jgi:osmotically-inducible protein OsmY